MRLRFLAAALVLVIGLGYSVSNAAAFFEGTIIAPPPEHSREGWVYVLGRNRSVRAVDVTGALLTFDEAVPATARCERAEELPEGSRVEVEAEIRESGEWIATHIDVLEVPAEKSQAANDLQAD